MQGKYLSEPEEWTGYFWSPDAQDQAQREPLLVSLYSDAAGLVKAPAQ